MPQTAFSLCRHIKTNGHRCKSPSLRDKPFCFFHAKLAKGHRTLLKSPQTPPMLHPETPGSAENTPVYAAPPPVDFHLPPLEDAESIQLSISLLIAAIATNRIDLKRAGLLLYGLQLASSNVRSVNIEPFADRIVRRVVQTKSGQIVAPPDENTHIASEAARLNSAGTHQVV